MREPQFWVFGSGRVYSVQHLMAMHAAVVFVDRKDRMPSIPRKPRWTGGMSTGLYDSAENNTL